MITTYLYRKGKPLEENISRADMLAALKDKEALLWVDLEAPSEFESETLIEIFNFHPLAIEDCLVDHSHPKVDDYDEYLFLVMHAVTVTANKEREAGKEADELETIELDLFLGDNYVVTFHQAPLPSIGYVRDLIRKKGNHLMGTGADRLVHAILDHLVDNYQPLLTSYDDQIDQLEDEIFNNPPADYLTKLLHLKRNIFNLRRIIALQRDTINFIVRNPAPFIRAEHLMYYRDIYDHLLRIYDTVEGFHEAMTSALQAYFSYSSNKLNDVMKRMTVLATLTLPSLIIASIYGMNFRHMPELAWPYGYPLALGLMVLTPVVMLAFMKWRKWI